MPARKPTRSGRLDLLKVWSAKRFLAPAPQEVKGYSLAASSAASAVQASLAARPRSSMGVNFS